MTEYTQILKEIKAIKESLISAEKYGFSVGDWMPKKLVMRFFDYGSTKLLELEKSKLIIYTKIGGRKFYSIKSIIDLMQKNIVK